MFFPGGSVRTLISFVLALAMAFAVSAQAVNTVSLSITASNLEVLYGHGLTLSGQLSTDVGSRSIGIYSQPLGQQRMRWVATVRSGRGGAWIFPVKPAIGTTYEARAGSVVTPPLSVGVKPGVVAGLLADGAVRAHVAPERTFAGHQVELQLATETGWVTIEKAVLDKHSDVVLRAPISQGNAKMRVAISANEGGRGFLGAGSHPFTARALSVSAIASASSVRFGNALKLAGRVSSGRAGQTVFILARGYGSTAPTEVATVISRAGGHWEYAVAPSIETSYRAAWNGIESRALVVGVRPALTIARLRGGRLKATVTPAIACAACKAELQRRIPRGWETIDQLPLGNPNRHIFFPPPIRAGTATLRIALSLSEAATGYFKTSSRPLAYRAQFVSLATYTVRYGHSVRLWGTISLAKAGERVTILARPYGHRAPSEGATVITSPGGRWSFRATPSIQTSYTARWGASDSSLLTVSVEPRVSAERFRDGRIVAHVAAARELEGRMVELQALLGPREWSTIEQLPLNRHESAVFVPPSTTGATTLRIALSHNQAGPGLRGSTSHPFAYHPVRLRATP